MARQAGLSSTEIVTPKVVFSLDKAYRGGTLRAAIVVKINKGWHINSNNPSEDFLIPTEVTFDSTTGLTVDKIIYPAGKMISFDFSEIPLSVYEKEIVIALQLKISDDADELRFSGNVNYQACNDFSCLAPAAQSFEAVISLAGQDQAANLINSEVFNQINFGHESKPVIEENEVGLIIEQYGFTLSLFFIFLAGLALNLTPCVYPLIPITISYFANQTDGKAIRSFNHALIYVLGMALIYSSLGVIAALSGSLFGAALQSPPVLIFIAAVMLLLAISMFGFYEIQVPTAVAQFAGSSKSGYFGSFFMGLTVGFIAAPCIGPFVLALLTYVGSTGSILIGFSMFFVLALGLGTPFLVLGTFSGLLQKLPRSGAWMVWVKKVFGVILLAMAGYFLKPVLPELLKIFLIPVVLFLGAIYIGFLEKTKFDSSGFVWIKRLMAIVFICIATWLIAPDENEAYHQQWLDLTDSTLAEAKDENMPVIIDFTAEWCLACKELDKYTFPHEEVVKRAGNFIFLRADLTSYASKPVQKIRERFNIKGLPTVIFLDQNGIEVEKQRIIGFVNGKEFAKRMDVVSRRIDR